MTGLLQRLKERFRAAGSGAGVAVSGVLLALAIASSTPGPAAAAEPPAAPKLLLLGVDGASWKVIGPMLASGRLPALERFFRNGAHSRSFETLESGASPLVWTTIATGRTPKDHGIESFVVELDNGSMVPVTSSGRKARAIWEIASMHDLSVGVVGYWASWPAERVRGYIVSDHANAALFARSP